MSTELEEAAGVVTTRTGKTHLDEGGFIRTIMIPGAAETLEDARANIAACGVVGLGVKRPILVDFREVRSQDRGARNYYGGPEADHVLTAAALLVGSPLTRVIANFYVGLNKTRFPTRMFTSEAAAIAWLRGFLT